MIPCALCDMQFKLALPEPDEIQFTVIGMALGLGDPIKMNKSKKKYFNFKYEIIIYSKIISNDYI